MSVAIIYDRVAATLRSQPEVFQVHVTAAKLNSKHQRGARSYSEIIARSHNFIISRNHYEIHGPHEHIATS